MANRFLVTLVTACLFLQPSLQGVEDNQIDSDKFNAFAEVAGAMLSQSGGSGDNNVGDIAGMIGSFMSSDGGKQVGDMLMNGNGAMLLQGLAGMMAQGGGAGGAGGGMDLGMLANVVSAFSQAGGDGKEGGSGGFNWNSAGDLLSSFMGQDGSKDFMSYLPTLMNLYEVMTGPVADRTAKEHAGHSWMLPPILEKLHILADQLMNSDLGRDVAAKLGAEKFMKIFSTPDGKFSYRKFVDMMENHSFRRHWIQMVTGRIGEFLTYFADPYTQKKTVATVQFFMNNFLKSYGIPKHALFDPTRPAETLTALANYLPKRYIGIKFNSAPYIVPAVNYVQDLLRLAENKGILGRAWNANELTAKLTDTINLEMIEPLARVNRAIRFAKKAPHCTRYVLCVANQHEPDEMLSLPGLKKALATSATFGASWLLSGHDKTPFWTVYGMVQEGKDCESFFKEECHEFHIEEEKVTTEYVHNEL